MSLVQRITDLTTRVTTEFKATKVIISGNNAGSLASLLTATKSSVVASINEIWNKFSGYTPISHVGAGGAEHAVVTLGSNGFMSAADKGKLDALAAGLNFKGVYGSLADVITAHPAATPGSFAILTRAGAASQFAIWDADAGPAVWVEAGGSVGGGANLSINRDGTSVTVVSDSGADGIIPTASITLAGVMSSTDKTKLDGVAVGATNTPLSATTPLANGAAAAGNATDAARSNHVHPMPTAAQVGAYTTTEIGNPETDFVSTFNAGLL